MSVEENTMKRIQTYIKKITFSSFENRSFSNEIIVSVFKHLVLKGLLNNEDSMPKDSIVNCSFCVKRLIKLLSTEAVVRRCSEKKLFLAISRNSHKNTCARVSFLIKLPNTCNFIKKDTLAQVFSCKFCERFKNTSVYRTAPVTAGKSNFKSFED